MLHVAIRSSRDLLAPTRPVVFLMSSASAIITSFLKGLMLLVSYVFDGQVFVMPSTWSCAGGVTNDVALALSSASSESTKHTCALRVRGTRRYVPSFVPFVSHTGQLTKSQKTPCIHGRWPSVPCGQTRGILFSLTDLSMVFEYMPFDVLLLFPFPSTLNFRICNCLYHKCSYVWVRREIGIPCVSDEGDRV